MILNGAYPWKFDDDQIRQVIEEDWGDSISEKEKREMLAMKGDELSSVAAPDITVENAESTFHISDFRQSGSDRVAYDEGYLSADGRSIESKRNPNDPFNFRIYFFLHDFDVRKPLQTSYGEIRIETLAPLPDYLRLLHPFRPVD
jgi:hypothetical protein